MLKDSIDLFFSFVPRVPAAQEFCIILLQHCCACVKHYTWVVRQGTVENLSRPQPHRATIARVLEPQHSVGSDTTSDGGGNSPAGSGSEVEDAASRPRLSRQTISTLHNLSEVKGQFFIQMWRHFAKKWGEWQDETFCDGRGETPEAQQRKKAATRAVEKMHEASNQVTGKHP